MKINTSTNNKVYELVDSVCTYSVDSFKERLGDKLMSLYVIGSMTERKISIQRPDINLLIILKGNVSSDNFLAIGDVCREIEYEFRNVAMIKIEFRPFRYILPRFKNDLEISVNPIIIGTEDIKRSGGIIANKWFTKGLKKSNILIHGKEMLKGLKVDKITRDDIKEGIIFDLSFFTVPLTRAPSQYRKTESNLLLNESFVSAKMISYLGLIVAMSEEELGEEYYIKLIQNKSRIPKFYKERYGKDTSRMVRRIYKIREKYLDFKNSEEIAREIFSIALSLGNIIRKKFYSNDY
ncbi:hypothetical protein ACFLY9_00635 [Patescibacteria group bacterium]